MNFTGKILGKQVIIQPALVKTNDAFPAPWDTPTGYFVYLPVRLIH